MNEAFEAKTKWVDSADAWIDGMRRGDTNRTHLLDPVMLDCVADVSGREVIDVGCGEGRFCRILAELGARVTGVDLTPKLVAQAKLLHPSGTYLAADAEDLPFSESSFDIAVSYVVLVDVHDFRKAIAEMTRVLKPGGAIVAANVNSFASTSATGWYRDGQGKKLHFPVDRYFEESAMRLEWGNMSIINWHRPLQAYMSAYLDAGLILRRFMEPRPTAEAVAEHPRMSDEARIALFNVMVWQKPAQTPGVV